MTISGNVHSRKPSFESSIGFLLSRLGMRHPKLDSDAHRASPNSLRARCSADASRAREPATTELAATIGTDPRNMGPVLDTIHPQIQRDTNPHDRRQRTVALTAPGRRIADQLADAAAGIEADFLSALDDEETETLRRLLLKLHAPTKRGDPRRDVPPPTPSSLCLLPRSAAPTAASWRYNEPAIADLSLANPNG